MKTICRCSAVRSLQPKFVKQHRNPYKTRREIIVIFGNEKGCKSEEQGMKNIRSFSTELFEEVISYKYSGTLYHTI